MVWFLASWFVRVVSSLSRFLAFLLFRFLKGATGVAGLGILLLNCVLLMCRAPFLVWQKVVSWLGRCGYLVG